MTDSFIAPHISWPAGHRAALCVIVQVDAPRKTAARTHGLDYAPSGLHHLLLSLEDLDVQVTTAWTEAALETFPQLAKRAAEQGHEIAVSGSDTSMIKSAISEARRITDQPVVGVVETLTSATAQGDQPGQIESETLWRLTGASGDTPILDAASGRVLIPSSPYWNDEAWLHPERPLPPSSMLEMWSTSLAAVRTRQGVMTIVLHPHIAGRPGILDVIVRLLDESIASGDVWISRADHLSTWWRDKRNESE